MGKLAGKIALIIGGESDKIRSLSID